MIKSLKYVMLLCLFCMANCVCLAQTSIQPKIMVIPYTTLEEDIRTVLENDANKRIVITKVKEAFDNRGVNTIAFLAKLKSIESGNVFNSENQQDIKTQIIDQSGADIYVETEIMCIEATSGNRVRVVVTAYDIATGASLANAIGDSGAFYSSDYGALGQKSIESCIGSFLNTMQNKFTDIAVEGKSIMIQIGFDESSQLSMESPVGNQGLLLQDEVELWIDEHCFNHNYHIQGISPKKMIIDDVKLLTTTTATRWSIELGKFFRAIGINISRSAKGNTIYITIK